MAVIHDSLCCLPLYQTIRTHVCFCLLVGIRALLVWSMKECLCWKSLSYFCCSRMHDLASKLFIYFIKKINYTLMQRGICSQSLMEYYSTQGVLCFLFVCMCLCGSWLILFYYRWIMCLTLWKINLVSCNKLTIGWKNTIVCYQLGVVFWVVFIQLLFNLLMFVMMIKTLRSISKLFSNKLCISNFAHTICGW